MFTSFQPADLSTLTLAEKRAMLKTLKENIKAHAALVRESKVAQKLQKAENAEARRQAAIEKAKAKLEKLLNKTQPVGRLAIKANRKPSKATVTTLDMLEANEIAKKFAAKKTA
jgi:hypothetical protein